MIIKKTREIKSPKTAVAWVKNYMDEVAKHKGKDLKELGISLTSYKNELKHRICWHFAKMCSK
jgi:hypothetical protein